MTYNVQMVDVGDNKKKKTKLQVVTDYNDRMEGGNLSTSTYQITKYFENKKRSTVS